MNGMVKVDGVNIYREPDSAGHGGRPWTVSAVVNETGETGDEMTYGVGFFETFEQARDFALALVETGKVQL